MSARSIATSHWAHWVYNKCGRCQEITRRAIGYAPWADPIKFDAHEQGKAWRDLCNTHAGANGMPRQRWDVRACLKCKVVHGDWSGVTDVQYLTAQAEEHRKKRKIKALEEKKGK